MTWNFRKRSRKSSRQNKKSKRQLRPPPTATQQQSSAQQASANKDLENREGTAISQQGSGASQSPVNQTENAPTQAASNTQTNSAPQTGASTQGGAPPAQGNSPPPAIIRVPQEDLKPLYDAVGNCEICQAKLAAAQGDPSDEKTRFAAATGQRDAAICAARGTFWKRTRTARHGSRRPVTRMQIASDFARSTSFPRRRSARNRRFAVRRRRPRTAGQMNDPTRQIHTGRGFKPKISTGMSGPIWYIMLI